jgi:hypothetical protein
LHPILHELGKKNFRKNKADCQPYVLLILVMATKTYACGGPVISLQHKVSLVQWIEVSLVQWIDRLLPVWGFSGLHHKDAQTHNRTRFLLLALFLYVGDPEVIDHWPRPRLRADNGKLH